MPRSVDVYAVLTRDAITCQGLQPAAGLFQEGLHTAGNGFAVLPHGRPLKAPVACIQQVVDLERRVADRRERLAQVVLRAASHSRLSQHPSVYLLVSVPPPQVIVSCDEVVPLVFQQAGQPIH